MTMRYWIGVAVKEHILVGVDGDPVRAFVLLAMSIINKWVGATATLSHLL